MPQAVFFDVTGTLLGLNQPVGEVYCRFIERLGLARRSDPRWAEGLEKAFATSLQQAPPLAFAGASESDLPELEKRWWRGRVEETVRSVGLDRCGLFEPFFEAVFAYYAGHDVWHLMPGCRQTLSVLAARRIRLAVVSNFDSRLPSLLKGLGIEEFFEIVVYSSRAGSAKPDGRIFQFALQQVQLAPGSVLHVGDSLVQDVQGARSVGMRAALFDPQGKYSREDGINRIERLTDIPDLLL